MKVLGAAALATDLDPHYYKKVTVFSIEQFIVQNIDEMSNFTTEVSLEVLESILVRYNELIDQYEDDPSLKIVIPDFGH